MTMMEITPASRQSVIRPRVQRSLGQREKAMCMRLAPKRKAPQVVDEEIRRQQKNSHGEVGGQVPDAEERNQHVHQSEIGGEARAHGGEITWPFHTRRGTRSAERDQLLQEETDRRQR